MMCMSGFTCRASQTVWRVAVGNLRDVSDPRLCQVHEQRARSEGVVCIRQRVDARLAGMSLHPRRNRPAQRCSFGVEQDRWHAGRERFDEHLVALKQRLGVATDPEVPAAELRLEWRGITLCLPAVSGSARPRARGRPVVDRPSKSNGDREVEKRSSRGPGPRLLLSATECAPGTECATVVETDFGRMGLAICYDIGWPDLWAQLAEQGAELVVWPSAYGGGLPLQAYACATPRA